MHPRPYYMKENPDPGRIASDSVNGVPDNTCHNLVGLLWFFTQDDQ